MSLSPHQVLEDVFGYAKFRGQQQSIIDATLQELDEILFAGQVNLSALNESYAALSARMGAYVERFVRFQIDNEEYAEQSLVLFDSPGVEALINTARAQRNE